MITPKEESAINNYIADVSFFIDLFQEHVDFNIKAALINGDTSDNRKEALALYKIACRLAHDWESFWVARGGCK